MQSLVNLEIQTLLKRTVSTTFFRGGQTFENIVSFINYKVGDNYIKKSQIKAISSKIWGSNKIIQFSFCDLKIHEVNRTKNKN